MKMNFHRRDLLLRLLLSTLLVLVSACAAHELTITLGQEPVYIEPAGAAGDKQASAAAIDSRTFGLNSFGLYNQPRLTWRLADQLREMHDLGLGFLRLSGGTTPAWARVATPNGVYDFSRFDRLLGSLSRSGLELMATLPLRPPRGQADCYPKEAGPRFPCDPAAWLFYLRAVVARYDGEHADYGCTRAAPDCYRRGDGQYPGWRPEERPRIKYWQIGNEVNLKNYWEDTPERYAELLNLSYHAVRETCPDCKVLLAGQAGLGVISGDYSLSPFYRGVLESLDERAFDIVDSHLSKKQGAYGGYSVFQDEFLEAIKKRGWARPRFWLTEVNTFSGWPKGAAAPQSEAEQAAELVRRYVAFLAMGVEKLCWTRLLDYHAFHDNRCSYFNFTGLIHNPLAPEDCHDPARPAGFGLSGRKLSFYSLKLLIDKLAGASKEGIRLVHHEEGVRLYEFERLQGPLYVAWWDWYEGGDEGEAKTVTLYLPDVPSEEVTITVAVPEACAGDDLTASDYPSFFRQEKAFLH
jgi:hypothetical protein